MAAEPEVHGVELEGIEEAEPDAPRCSKRARGGAEAIVIGPSNPVISIGPILAVPGMREAIAASGAPVDRGQPLRRRRRLSRVRPSASWRHSGARRRAAGVASLYAGLIDAMVVDAGDPDPPPSEIPTLVAPTLMEGAAGRRPGGPHRARLRR